jgi:hypothetical protein
MSKPRSKKLKKTAFVPRGLFVGALAAASVIPLCACGGTVEGGSNDGGGGLHADVARQAFDGQTFGVAIQGFEGGLDVIFTVACQCFDAGMDGPTDAMFIADVAISAFDGSDGQFGVADRAFGGDDAPMSVANKAFDGG